MQLVYFSAPVVQEIEIWPSELLVYAQLRILLAEWDTPTSQRFWNIGSSNLGQTTEPSNSKKTKQNKKNIKKTLKTRMNSKL